jgi:hypothetical protein
MSWQHLPETDNTTHMMHGALDELASRVDAWVQRVHSHTTDARSPATTALCHALHDMYTRLGKSASDFYHCVADSQRDLCDQHARTSQATVSPKDLDAYWQRLRKSAHTLGVAVTDTSGHPLTGDQLQRNVQATLQTPQTLALCAQFTRLQSHEQAAHAAQQSFNTLTAHYMRVLGRCGAAILASQEQALLALMRAVDAAGPLSPAAAQAVAVEHACHIKKLVGVWQALLKAVPERRPLLQFEFGDTH